MKPSLRVIALISSVALASLAAQTSPPIPSLLDIPCIPSLLNMPYTPQYVQPRVFNPYCAQPVLLSSFRPAEAPKGPQCTIVQWLKQLEILDATLLFSWFVAKQWYAQLGCRTEWRDFTERLQAQQSKHGDNALETHKFLAGLSRDWASQSSEKFSELLEEYKAFWSLWVHVNRQGPEFRPSPEDALEHFLSMREGLPVHAFSALN